MTLKDEFESLKNNLSNLDAESKLTATIKAENTGELMDLALRYNADIIKPFSESAQQNFYYFNFHVKKNIIITVKSNPKKLK